MRKIIHLIPYDSIGGVETAARSMARVDAHDLAFRVETLFSSRAAKNRWHTFNPFAFVATLARIWRAAPEVLIVSLWRACAAGVALKIARPRLRLVLFLHSASDAHFLDRFFNRLAARLASRIWADSTETLKKRMPDFSKRKGEVISFVTSCLEPLPASPPKPRFAFWGRIHPVKGLERALGIFAAVRKARPDARFDIIGPDGGALARIRSVANALHLGQSVRFHGGLEFDQIRALAAQASFYLQTSVSEGMAMSVVEAMRCGLVPVVTPVGEIANYARDRKNAIVVSNDAEAAGEVLGLLVDEARYFSLRDAALATWANSPLYRDSVLGACRELLKLRPPALRPDARG